MKYDPIPWLLNSHIPEIEYFTKRDLLCEKVPLITSLWESKNAQRIFSKQHENGGFAYPNPKEKVRSREDYDLLETYYQLGFLVEMYGVDKRHESIRKIKDFLLSYQSNEGDIRGIYWNQYSPNYTAGMLELLIKAGYANDPDIKKSLDWLLSCRQQDGGWAIPIRTLGKNIANWMKWKEPKLPDVTKPSSWMVTGVVLRAFAVHPEYKDRQEVKNAAESLLNRMFQKGSYPDRKDASYWTKFTFPFCYSDLISVLDTTTLLGFGLKNESLKKGIDWLVNKQEHDGSWRLQMLKGDRRIQPYWHGLNICRIITRL